MPREGDRLENVVLSQGTTQSIGECVQKVLADLGNLEPPLELSVKA
jgi:hypothetical protein